MLSGMDGGYIIEIELSLDGETLDDMPILTHKPFGCHCEKMWERVFCVRKNE